MLFYVQLWNQRHEQHPTVQQRVQAPSEAHAVVAVMRQHHLHCVYRAWAGPSAQEPPTVRLLEVTVKGKIRHWAQEPEPGTSWDRLVDAAAELGYRLTRDMQGITLEHDLHEPLRVSWRELDCPALTKFLYTRQRQHRTPRRANKRHMQALQSLGLGENTTRAEIMNAFRERVRADGKGEYLGDMDALVQTKEHALAFLASR